MRWTARMKERFVLRYLEGEIDTLWIERRHGVSAEEFMRWVARWQADGLRGLSVKATQERRGE